MLREPLIRHIVEPFYRYCRQVAERIIWRYSQREPDFVVGSADDPYLKRWFIIPKNRVFTLYLHQFCRSDDDRALHDHPAASMSLILRGRYIEHFKGNRKKTRQPGDIILRRPSTAHRVELFTSAEGKPIPTWTIFIFGPRVRQWGFACPKGWRHWKTFHGIPMDQEEAVGHERGPGCD